MSDYKLICEFRGGSHAAELNTPSSDLDMRGCYLSTNLAKVMALGDGKEGIGAPVITVNNDLDMVYYELRHFLMMLRSGNSNAMEMMFNENWTHMTPEFSKVKSYRFELINPASVYRSTRGYAQSESVLATGERTGKLGGKRQAAVAKYGFSPKNYVNLFKILHAATCFFRTGSYLLTLADAYPFVHALLLEIKKNPEHFTKPQLAQMYDTYMAEFELAWKANKDTIEKQYQYKENVAAKLAAELYLPIIQEHTDCTLLERSRRWLHQKMNTK